MEKFKQGDIVKCKDAHNAEDLTAGVLYNVKRSKDGAVTVEGNNGKEVSYYAHRFMLSVAAMSRQAGLCAPTIVEEPAQFTSVEAVLDVFESDLLPTVAEQRKATPVYSGVLKYFPRALQAVAKCSQVGNDQHNPGEPLHWAREKSGDELDALTRHLLDAGTMDTDGVLHSTKVAWRALANLEKELEKAGE